MIKKIAKAKPITTLIAAAVLYTAARCLVSFSYSGVDKVKSALSGGEIELLGFSLVVAIGVAGEAIDRLKPRHAMFAWWVAFGVTGEMLADGQIYNASGRLQRATDTEVKHARDDAKDAVDSAIAATKKAEAAAEKATRIAESIAPRTIGVPKTFALFQMGERQPIVVVRSYAQDVEGALLATQVVSSLKAAGFRAENESGSESMAGAPGTGVFIASDDHDLSQRLVDWFLSYGVVARPGTMPIGMIQTNVTEHSETPDAIVWIGAKPLLSGNAE